MEHEGGQKLQFFLDGGDKSHEEQVIEPDERDGQKSDRGGPEPVPPVSEPEDIDEFAYAISSEQINRLCKTDWTAHDVIPDSIFQIPKINLRSQISYIRITSADQRPEYLLSTSDHRIQKQLLRSAIEITFEIWDVRSEIH